MRNTDLSFIAVRRGPSGPRGNARVGGMSAPGAGYET